MPEYQFEVDRHRIIVAMVISDFFLFIFDVLAFVAQSPNLLLQSADSTAESFLDSSLVDNLHDLFDLPFIDLAIVAVCRQ